MTTFADVLSNFQFKILNFQIFIHLCIPYSRFKSTTAFLNNLAMYIKEKNPHGFFTEVKTPRQLLVHLCFSAVEYAVSTISFKYSAYLNF